MSLLRKSTTLLGAAAFVYCAATASGQVVFEENFDSYTAGDSIHGQGIWSSWDGDPTWESFVTDLYSNSPSNSLDVKLTSDTIGNFSSLGMNAGIWQISVNVYIPSDLVAPNNTFFILLDQYADGGPYDWRVQLQMDPVLGTITADFNAGSTDLVFDQWAPIVVDVDLDNDLHSISYNGTVIVDNQSWTGSMNGSGTLNVAATDLFAYDATSVYYDDYKIEYMGSGAACLEISVDNNNAGSNSTFCVTGGIKGRQGGIFYSFIPTSFDTFVACWDECRAGGGPMVGCAMECLGALFNNQLALGNFDANGSLCNTIKVPCAAGGKTIYMYAATVGADGKICDSKVTPITFAPC